MNFPRVISLGEEPKPGKTQPRELQDARASVPRYKTTSTDARIGTHLGPLRNAKQDQLEERYEPEPSRDRFCRG